MPFRGAEAADTLTASKAVDVVMKGVSGTSLDFDAAALGASSVAIKVLIPSSSTSVVSSTIYGGADNDVIAFDGEVDKTTVRGNDVVARQSE